HAGGPVDHVVVGQHEARGRNDHPGAFGRLAVELEVRHDVDQARIHLLPHRIRVERRRGGAAARRVVVRSGDVAGGDPGRRGRAVAAERDRRAGADARRQRGYGHVDQHPPTPRGTPPRRGIGHHPAGSGSAALAPVAAALVPVAALARVSILVAVVALPVASLVTVAALVPVPALVSGAGLVSWAGTPWRRAEGDGVRVVAVRRRSRARVGTAGPRVLLGRLPPAACAIAVVLL